MVAISESEFEKRFYILEQKSLYAVSYRGFCLWSLIKFPLYRSMRRYFAVESSAPAKKSGFPISINARFLSQGFQYFLSELQVAKAQQKGSDTPIISVHTSSAMRYRVKGGCFRHSFFDDLYDCDFRKFDLVLIETDDSSIRIKRCAGLQQFISGEFLRFPSPFQLGYIYRDHELRQCLNLLLKRICDLALFKEYDKQMSHIFRNRFKHFELNLAYFFHRYKRAKRFMKNVAPDVVVVTNSPGHQPLVLAAKAKNVPVIEMQHGDISQFHPGFSWPGWARPMKRILPVPDYVITYGQYWANQILENRFWKTKEILPFGNCRLDFFQKEKRGRKKRPRTSGELGNAVKCVFTTQKTTREEAVPFLRGFCRMAEKKSCRMTLYIRVHPLEEEEGIEEYKGLEREFPGKCYLTTEKDCSLYDLLWDSDIHCSVYSTCLYESLALGTPTAVLCLTGSDYVFRLIDAGVVRVCQTPEDLLSLIRDADICGPDWQAWCKATEQGKQFVSCDGAIKTLVGFLNKVLNDTKSVDFTPTK